MPGTRYLRIFGVVAGVVSLLLIGFNVLGALVLARAPQSPSMEMLSDYARVIKPYWQMRSDARVVVIGNSKVRDAFDPVLIKSELGLKLFNYGVSGATAYEALRYTQDTLARPGVDTVIMNADVFTSTGIGYGFNEATLAVAADGKPTPNRNFMLLATRFLSGGAIALNGRILYLLAAMDGASAEQRPDLFHSYRRLRFAALRREQQTHELGSLAMSAGQIALMNRTFDQFCHRRVRALVYFSPDHFSITAMEAAYDPVILRNFRHAVTDAVLRHNQTCGADIHLFDFMHLNVVTSERILPGQPSRYYREPVHVRPPVGVMLLRRMLTGRLPGAASDFGQEITAAREPLETISLNQDLVRWWSSRQAGPVRAVGARDGTGVALSNPISPKAEARPAGP